MKDKWSVNWEFKSLGELGAFIRGVTYKKDMLISSSNPDAIKILRSNNIQKKVDLTELKYLPKSAIKECQMIQNNDILFCMSNGSKKLVGKNVLIKSLPKSSFGAFCSVFRSNGFINPLFISYYLASDNYKNAILKFSKGSGILNLKNSQLETLTIPAPPLQEQQKIVKILDATLSKIDQAISLINQNIEKLEQLNASILDEVFKENDWEAESLENLTIKIGSGSTPRGGRSSYKTSGISLIRSMNVHDNGFREKGLAFIDDEQAKKLSNVTIEENDVLLNITGASVARCCIIPKKYIPARVNQHVSILRCKKDKLLPEFLHLCLISPYNKNKLLISSGGGATREAITKTSLVNFKIKLPSIDKQKVVVKYLANTRSKNQNLTQHYQNKLQSLQDLKKSVLDSAFKGKLRKVVTEQKVITITDPYIAQQKKQHARKKAPQQAMVIAFAIEEHQKYNRNLYRTKGEKTVEVVEKHLNLDFGREPIKMAAGPAAFQHLVKVVEPLAKRSKWFGVERSEKDGRENYKYIPLDSYNPILLRGVSEFKNVLTEMKRVISLFAKLKTTHHAEVITTTYSGWNNLIIRKESISNEAIVTEAREHWHEKKLNINRDEFFEAIDWLKNNNLIPVGNGKEVK